MKFRTLLSIAGLVVTSHLIGCGSSDTSSAGGEVPGTRLSREAVVNGCRTVCATCRPGVACPDLCHIECPPEVVTCGPKVCRDGDVCCNESCGICTAPGGHCPQHDCAPRHPCVDTVLCIRGFHFDSQRCACVPDAAPTACVETELCIRGDHFDSQLCRCVPDVAGSCTTDGDCRLVADYCTGCNCRALSSGDPDPVCSGPGVRCFADPCLDKSVFCVRGRCSLTPRVAHRTHTPHQPHAPHRPHGM